jgi:deazaflavin-dependent oxidoreductase (nitroreductase family)
MSKHRFETLRKFNRAILNPIMRSFVSGRFSYYSLIYHLGRRSGKEYATPVMAVVKETHIYIPLPYGPDTDWCLNLLATGRCRAKIKRKVYYVSNPELVDATAAAAAFPSDFRTKIERTKLNQFLRLSISAEP